MTFSIFFGDHISGDAFCCEKWCLNVHPESLLSNLYTVLSIDEVGRLGTT